MCSTLNSSLGDPWIRRTGFVVKPDYDAAHRWSRDNVVIELNRQAQIKLRSENQPVILPGATHLFEELGTLERVAELASH